MEFSQDAARYDSFMVYQKKVRATGINLWVSGNKVAQGDCLIEKNPIAVIAQLDDVPPCEMKVSVGTQKREC